MAVGHGVDGVLVRGAAREGQLNDLLEGRFVAVDLAGTRVDDDLGVAVLGRLFDLVLGVERRAKRTPLVG
jgi:hypothetical protein